MYINVKIIKVLKLSLFDFLDKELTFTDAINSYLDDGWILLNTFGTTELDSVLLGYPDLNFTK